MLADGLHALQGKPCSGPVVVGLRSTHACSTRVVMSCIAAAVEAALARVRNR